MNNPVIITCAVTGSGDTTGVSPHVPITPRQIAAEALAASAAGAAIVHLHVRDPATGAPSRDLDLYRETVTIIRESGDPVLINLTTGAGARFTPDANDPNRNSAPGMARPEERVAHVLELKPDICSLDIATMNFGEHAFVNTPDHIRHMARAIREAGVKPELEVFDLGHIVLVQRLQGEELFQDPPLFQLCTGVPWGAPATPRAMFAMLDMLPSGAEWSAFGVGAKEFPMVALTAAAGGHVRVGLEDNLYMSRGVLAEGNAPLVARAAEIVQLIGREVASPDKARQILRIG